MIYLLFLSCRALLRMLSFWEKESMQKKHATPANKLLGPQTLQRMLDFHLVKQIPLTCWVLLMDWVCRQKRKLIMSPLQWMQRRTFRSNLVSIIIYFYVWSNLFWQVSRFLMVSNIFFFSSNLCTWLLDIVGDRVKFVGPPSGSIYTSSAR